MGSDLDQWLSELGASRVLGLVTADENVAESKNSGECVFTLI